jgi:hypothetical protein
MLMLKSKGVYKVDLGTERDCRGLSRAESENEKGTGCYNSFLNSKN